MTNFLLDIPAWVAQTWMTFSFMFPVTLAQSLMLGFIALAIMIPFRMLNFPDLTSEGAFPLGACVCVVLMSAGLPAWIAVIGAVVFGFAAGCCTAYIHLRFKIHTLLAGILMITMLYSIDLRILGKGNLPVPSTATTLFDTIAIPSAYLASHLEGIPIIKPIMAFAASLNGSKILLAGALSLIVFFLLLSFFRTEKGMAVRAVGSNPEMSEAQGINVWAATIGGVGIAGSFSALSGALVANSQGFADVNMGLGMLIKSLAALIIGEALIGKKTLFRQMLAPFGGALLYYQIESLLIAAGVQPSDMNLAAGLFVLIMLALPTLRGGRGPAAARETIRE